MLTNIHRAAIEVRNSGHGITYSQREEMNTVTVPSDNGINK